jgi:hypothetical protein
MRRAASVVLIALLFGCMSGNTSKRDSSARRDSHDVAAGQDTLWLLASEPARDAIHATDTEASLIERFGAANVRRDSINEGEGMYRAGVILFPNDATRRAQVMWKDAEPRANPDRILIGESRSRWAVFPGVSIGSCLDDVERINGRPFRIYGWGFDGAGVSDGWNGGRIDSLWGSTAPQKRVWLRFVPSVDVKFRRDQIGDVLIPTTDSILRAARPCVSEIGVSPR